jgi:hypothetical protein
MSLIDEHPDLDSSQSSSPPTTAEDLLEQFEVRDSRVSEGWRSV